MNWKEKYSKPFKVGDTVQQGSSRYKVLAMDGTDIKIMSLQNNKEYIGTEKNYFRLLKKV